MLLLTACILATAQPLNLPHEQELGELSHALGHLLAHNIETVGLPLDIQELFLGFQEAQEGKASPMPFEELLAKITDIQAAHRERLSQENLKRAEEFLAKQAGQEGITLLEEGKLQYQVLTAGKGEMVLSDSTPLVRMKGSFLNGPSLREKNEEMRLSLDEAIVGLKIALLGMREGEKRQLHIHPSLAYGDEDGAPPSSLLSLEVEVLQANAPAQAALYGPSRELAHSLEQKLIVR